MINVKTLKGLDENELFQIEALCNIVGEYSKDYLQVVYCKSNDNEIFGCLLYQNRFPNISNIFYLIVKPEFQNKGIASNIINLYKKVTKHMTIMCISKTSPAITFFSKHQFNIMCKEDFFKYEIDIVCDDDDIVMMYSKNSISNN